jgi:uncharacterized protein YecT (DUF1311 family)
MPRNRLNVWRLIVLGAVVATLSHEAVAGDPSLKPLRMVGSVPTSESLASFDCKQAAIRVERMICDNGGLARADRSLAHAYWALLSRTETSQRTELREAQRDWLRQRNACERESCVSQAYSTRQADLDGALSRRNEQLRASVSHVGQCEMTRIESIGPRLELVEGDPPQGASVTFANAVQQVSYDREPALLHSRVGDRVRVCLTSIPRGCPPGDDRGRVYDVSNLRTGEQWQLPDASHRCGGA